MIVTLISQAKQRIDRTISTIVHKAIAIAAAVVLLLFAVAFGLVAAYHALTGLLDLSPMEAAGIVGGGLLALGLLVLLLLPLVSRTSQKDRTIVTAPSEALSLVDKGVTGATRQLGAFPIVAIAFATGFLASRR